MELFFIILLTLFILFLLLLILYFIHLYKFSNKSNNTILQTSTNLVDNSTTQLQEIIMVDSYNFNHSLRKEYNFYITSKNQTFISRSQNNLYFFYQCLIQANHPIELDSKLNYFEIKIIKNDNANLPFYIGLGTKADYLIDLKASAFLQVNKQRILINGKNAYKLNTLLPNNSVIGVLYRPLPKNEVTFTLNGNIISTRKLSIEQNHLLYPTILGSRDIVLNFNFGYNPFLYDYANQSNLGCMHFLSDHELPPNYVVEVQ